MSTNVDFKISLELFSLDAIKMACFALLDRVDAEITTETDNSNEILVTLQSVRYKNSEELRAVFFNELIASSVKINSLNANKELRNYFARTAFVPTTDNFDIISKLLEEQKSAEPKSDCHQKLLVKNTILIRINDELNQILMYMNGSDFCLQDIFKLCFALSDVAVSEIDLNNDGTRVVRMRPKSSEMDLHTVRSELERSMIRYLSVEPEAMLKMDG